MAIKKFPLRLNHDYVDIACRNGGAKALQSIYRWSA